MRVVLENLIGNAWKFTSKTSGAHVELGSMSSGGQTTYYVRDNGAGFDMRFAAQLFTPFRRLHRESEFGGTGIGLATVQRIIRRHGGEVWAESAVGRGATFYFRLDAAGAADEGLRHRPADAVSSGTKREHGA
jgi:light-regulated signal transduction histidine kinase (bacteriophytochrome)